MQANQTEQDLKAAIGIWVIVDDNDDIVSACLTIAGRNVAMTSADEAQKEAKRLAVANGLRLRVRKCDGPAIYPTL